MRCGLRCTGGICFAEVPSSSESRRADKLHISGEESIVIESLTVMVFYGARRKLIWPTVAVPIDMSWICRGPMQHEEKNEASISSILTILRVDNGNL